MSVVLTTDSVVGEGEGGRVGGRGRTRSGGGVERREGERSVEE